MKQSHKFAAVAALGLGIAVAAAYANPGQMGGGMGPQGGKQHGAQGGMQHGTKGGMEHGGMVGGAAGHGAGQQLMTPEERTALMEKMHNAATPEERQKIAEATRTEMQKRAQEKGITLPEQRGPRTGTARQAPATTEHAH
jgi:Spy/CpxP family protein refolding chaperone